MSLIIMCITVSAMMGTAVKEVQDKEEQGRLLRRLDHQPVWTGSENSESELIPGSNEQPEFQRPIIALPKRRSPSPQM